MSTHTHTEIQRERKWHLNSKPKMQSNNKHSNKGKMLPSINQSLAATSMHPTKESAPKRKRATVSQIYMAGTRDWAKILWYKLDENTKRI